MIISFIVLGAGIGTAEVITNDLILSAVPADKAGAASAISETAYEFGSVMGTAVLGGLTTMVFGRQLASHLGERAEDPAFETLGSALERAGEIGGRLGDELADTVVRAFDLGVQWAAGGATVVVLPAAVLTAFGLKGAGRGPQTEAAEVREPVSAH